MITFIILIGVILGIALFPLFIMYSLTKKINWKMLKDIYKDWLNS